MEGQLRSRGGSTNAQGELALRGLAPGEYTVRASAEGITSPIQRIRVEARGEFKVPLVLSQAEPNAH